MMSREMVRLHLLQQVADPAAFQLEHALGLAALQQGVGLAVVQREFLRVDPLARRLLDQVHRGAEDRQVAQAQEVHLQQAGLLDVAHRPLGDDVLLAGHAAQRDVFGQRLVGDHHGGGMRADVARQALDLAGQIDHFADLAVGFVDLAEVLALLQRLVERDVQLFGHHGRDLVDAGQRDAQRAAHVLDRRPGRQRAERADLGDVVFAVLFLDVADDLAAAFLAEVDIDIGRFLAAFVQEPLEQQVVADRAHVAQVQGVRDQRAHAAAAGRGRHAHLAGLADEVPHDQEVVGKAELADHAQLAVQAVEHHLGQLAAGTHLLVVRIAFVQALRGTGRGGTARAFFLPAAASRPGSGVCPAPGRCPPCRRSAGCGPRRLPGRGTRRTSRRGCAGSTGCRPSACGSCRCGTCPC